MDKSYRTNKLRNVVIINGTDGVLHARAGREVHSVTEVVRST